MMRAGQVEVVIVIVVGAQETAEEPAAMIHPLSFASSSHGI
jgi:hypothetical protein